MNFDEIIERRNTHSSKWDRMETIYGVSPKDGLSMWVADMDFKTPGFIIESIKKKMGEFQDLKILKVKGHSGHPENEKADELARAGMAPFKP